MLEILPNTALQVVDSFHTESNNKRYLGNAVFGKKWVNTHLNKISTAQYNYDHLVMALNKSILLEHVTHKASISSKTYYGRVTTKPKYARKYGSLHRNDPKTLKITIAFINTIPADTIEAKNEIAFNRIINSRDMSHETRANSETTHAVVLNVHANQVVFALEIDVRVKATRFYVQIYPYEIFYVLNVVVQTMNAHIEDVLYYLNRSRKELDET